MKLFFFDIDETLFKTFAKIKVLKDNQEVAKLSNQEFNSYSLKEGESFSFEEFKSTEIFKKSEAIQKMIDRLIEYHNYPDSKTFLLTARADFEDKEGLIEYLKSFGIEAGHRDNSETHIIRCGDIAVSEKKPIELVKMEKVKEEILRVNSNQVEVYLFDDYIKNVEKLNDITNCKELSKKNISVKYRGELVKDGETIQVFENSNNKHIQNLEDRKYVDSKYGKEYDTILKNISKNEYSLNEALNILKGIEESELKGLIEKHLLLYSLDYTVFKTELMEVERNEKEISKKKQTKPKI